MKFWNRGKMKELRELLGDNQWPLMLDVCLEANILGELLEAWSNSQISSSL